MSSSELKIIWVCLTSQYCPADVPSPPAPQHFLEGLTAVTVFSRGPHLGLGADARCHPREVLPKTSRGMPPAGQTVLRERPNLRWTASEVAALRRGIDKYGAGKWQQIITDPQLRGDLGRRSNIDLKDKWRNLKLKAPQSDSGSDGGSGPRRKPSKRPRQPLHVSSDQVAGGSAGGGSPSKRTRQTLRRPNAQRCSSPTADSDEEDSTAHPSSPSTIPPLARQHQQQSPPRSQGDIVSGRHTAWQAALNPALATAPPLFVGGGLMAEGVLRHSTGSAGSTSSGPDSCGFLMLSEAQRGQGLTRLQLPQQSLTDPHAVHGQSRLQTHSQQAQPEQMVQEGQTHAPHMMQAMMQYAAAWAAARDHHQAMLLASIQGGSSGASFPVAPEFLLPLQASAVANVQQQNQRTTQSQPGASPPALPPLNAASFSAPAVLPLGLPNGHQGPALSQQPHVHHHLDEQQQQLHQLALQQHHHHHHHHHKNRKKSMQKQRQWQRQQYHHHHHLYHHHHQFS
mmetsp:Transcript_17267/g.51693  ORF Transcript_17267/g.51693 Transcript_17267/m.51693 type:complete len:510 (+) Transcript_17267:108-1637(+)